VSAIVVVVISLAVVVARDAWRDTKAQARGA